jgi:hypothetical protein
MSASIELIMMLPLRGFSSPGHWAAEREFTDWKVCGGPIFNHHRKLICRCIRSSPLLKSAALPEGFPDLVVLIITEFEVTYVVSASQ